MGLTWEHVDFENNELLVRHSLDQLGNHRPTKTQAGMRDVPMPRLVADALRDWQKTWRPNDGGFVFRGKRGVQIKSPNFHANYWHPALRAAKLPEFDDKGRRFHFHALRHLCSSMMIAGGIPIMDTARLLGHNSFDETLQTYAHPVFVAAQRHAHLERISDQLRNMPVGNDARVTHGLLTS